MRRQSGICIELNHDRSIFLVEDGQFIKGTPAGKPSIGEKASFYPFEKKSAIRWQPVMAPVIAAVAAFLLFMSVLVLPAEEAFGYIQVQINPGIELGINDEYEVVSVRELNSDGHDLIHQLGDWENDSLFNVLNQVFDLAVTEKTKEIMITAVEEDGSEFDQAIKKVVLAVSSGAENEQLAIQMKEATKEQWRQSKENHIPVGQLIPKAEILNNQPKPNVQNSGEKTETVTDPKENKAADKQKTKVEKNNDKEKKNTKPQNENKTIPPAAEKKTVPSAVKKKQDDPSPETKQQKKPKPDNKPEEPGNKNKNSPPAKQQEKAKPTKPVPKEKPLEKKEPPHSESKAGGNSEAPGQQKENHAPAASSNSINKAELQPSLDQEKKTGQSPDHGREDKRQDQKEKENSPISENKQENKAEE